MLRADALQHGYQLEALQLARRFVRVFEDAEAIVAPSGSCAAMVRDFYPRLAELAAEREADHGLALRSAP